jgi:hypothetical protein
VPFGEPTSAWWFFGTLTPEHATGFNVQEVQVEDLGRIEVYHDRISVWARPPGWTVADPAAARELFALVVGAYALVSGVPLSWTLDGWVEATQATVEGSTLGAMIDTRGRTTNPMKQPEELECKRMRVSAEVAVAARSLPGYRLALRDIHSALDLDQLARSDDAFVYAHRALAGAARAVSNRERGDVTRGDWQTLADFLGLSADELEEKKKPLDEARGAAAHGDENDDKLKEARASRTHIINEARLLLAEAVVREPRFTLARDLLAPAPPMLPS